MHHSLSESDQLEGLVKLTKLPNNTSLSFSLNDESDSWIKDVLQTFCNSVQSPDEEEVKIADGSNIEVTLKITRRYSSEYSDFVTVEGDLSSHYETYCVKCLETLKRSFTSHFDACFLPESLEDTEEFADATHVYLNDAEYELYFYKKGEIDLIDLINEQMVLNADEYELCKEDCKGLCPVCGANRNEVDCGH